MTRDDIILMAEQAGFVIDQEAKKYQPNCISHTHYLIDEPLTRFEALVRADEREACAQMVERMGIAGYGTLAIAGAIRVRR
jgi:hypothetical protein